MSTHNQVPGQLGFDTLLKEASKQNTEREFERQTAHLPSNMEDALPFYRALLEQHRALMLATDSDSVFELREEAYLLARRLNGGNPAIRANDDAPACVLERLTTAMPGDMPLWGQVGEFIIDVRGTRARIVMDGLFGLGGFCLYWPGFEAHCVDPGKPFISETGYHRFIGMGADAVPGITPDAFARAVIETYVPDERKGKLVAVREEYLATAE